MVSIPNMLTWLVVAMIAYKQDDTVIGWLALSICSLWWLTVLLVDTDKWHNRRSYKEFKLKLKNDPSDSSYKGFLKEIDGIRDDFFE